MSRSGIIPSERLEVFRREMAPAPDGLDCGGMGQNACLAGLVAGQLTQRRLIAVIRFALTDDDQVRRGDLPE